MCLCRVTSRLPLPHFNPLHPPLPLGGSHLPAAAAATFLRAAPAPAPPTEPISQGEQRSPTRGEQGLDTAPVRTWLVQRHEAAAPPLQEGSVAWGQDWPVACT
ncbi:EGF-like module-containing mucin-like hormone receptor-like 3 [Platysternon megacephalum]|uniref:EGF-like module-containing mucin-like hormone receptor-like 3 n=1 Tax=Platysternon megacephalum TaxID=55544 RepID=A0A4D9DLL1_9SAUR|nr:EGF-like module-containing mucin-like hormone receptor-like 3 [Platysternon megacephalum]